MRKLQEMVKGELVQLLLDYDNDEPILINDKNGNEVIFEQIAVVPYIDNIDVPKLYVIMQPIEKKYDNSRAEEQVFLVDVDEKCNAVLRAEENDEIIKNILWRYYEVLIKSEEIDLGINENDTIESKLNKVYEYRFKRE